jgi:hypothetical protein
MKRNTVLPVLLILVSGLALVAFGIYRHKRSPEGSMVIVKSIGKDENRVVARQSLSSDETVTIPVEGPLGTTMVEIVGDRAHVVSSPCPDKVCIRMGWLRRVGDYSACLPNRVLVEVVDQ